MLQAKIWLVVEGETQPRANILVNIFMAVGESVELNDERFKVFKIEHQINYSMNAVNEREIADTYNVLIYLTPERKEP